MHIDSIGGRYQIISHLGGGGFGQTYLAKDLHLPGHPRCVVKQLKPKVTKPEAFQAACRLFNTEAEVLYALGHHPQIPQLFAHFEEGQQFYLVQEWVEGDLFSQVLRAEAPCSAEAVKHLLTDILSTLAFVHQQQVIHRDIKPSNLIRRQVDGRIVLIDFGSVKQLSTLPLEPIADDQVSITIAVGSLGYMPNEQFAGQPYLSSDIYAVGMLAIQALTGIDAKQLAKDPRTSEIVWPIPEGLDPTFAALIDRMVRYDFRQRYDSAVETLAALQALDAEPVLVDLPPQAKPTVQKPQSEETDEDTTILFNVPQVSTDGTYLIWLERGDEYFQGQKYEAAIACYDKSIQIQPTDYLAWFKRAITLENLHRYEEAIAAYDEVLASRPDDYLAWYRRGKSAETAQQFDTALVAYQKVLQLQPRNYWAWHDQGHIYELSNRWEDALAAYSRAVQLKSDFKVAIASRQRVLNRLERVDDLYQLEHYEDAISACDTILSDRPDDHLAWLMRGMALENMGQHQAAAQSYQRVTEIQPSDHLAWYKYAAVVERLQAYEDALAAYTQVTTLQPNNPWAWYDRGRMCEHLGELEDAMVAYDRAAQVKPGFQDAISHYQRILNQLKRGRIVPQGAAHRPHLAPGQTPAAPSPD